MRQFLEDVRDRWRDDVTVQRRLLAASVVLALLLAFALLQLRSDPGPAASSAPPSTGVRDDARDAIGVGAPAGSSPPAVPVAQLAGTTEPATTEPATTEPGTTTAAAVTTTMPSPSPTNPDGTALPLVAVFDTDAITISGQVPSEAARQRLIALAQANSKFPEARVIDDTIVNPAVPISVGVRVIELNSARFPEGSADILPEHAQELDRVANVMKALPNVSLLVVGHADQRGDEVTNFAVSDQRARAVVNYLIYLGISPSRLASRAAGESDLLTLGDDDAALALNRRTEFVFGGLLIE